MIPASASCRCLFGDNPDTTYREMFYPKPAYYGVRNAITNYFGKAFAIRDSDGVETARFIENGNVVLMKPSAAVHENTTATSTPNWATALNKSGKKFIIKDTAENYLAIITEDSCLYLHGTVNEFQNSLNAATPAFRITGRDGAVRCLIDNAGNLKMLKDEQGGNERPPNGYLLVHGIPYELVKNHSGDPIYVH